MPKIIIVTTGQPSTNPRMVKEYQALKKAGYDVTVLYSYWVDWAVETDKVLFEKGELDKKDFILTGGSPQQQPWKYWLSRLLHKVSRKLARRWPSKFEVWAIARPSVFLYLAVRKRKADLFIGHNLGALFPVVSAASKFRSACGFDLEDFYSGQFSQEEEAFRIATRLEKEWLPACNFLIAASPLIAEAYQTIVRQQITVVNNVFSKTFLQPVASKSSHPLRLFWFSQTVGQNRGLETIVQAINLLPDCDIQFDIMGNPYNGYSDTLYQLIERKEALRFLPPVPADDLFAIAAGYDVGMAAEVPHNMNRDICLTNKLFVYLAAGNCVVASDTKAQQLFMQQHSSIGFVYGYQDAASLAGIFKLLYNDPMRLIHCRQQASALAASRYNWEYEVSLLIQQVQQVLQ